MVRVRVLSSAQPQTNAVLFLVPLSRTDLFNVAKVVCVGFKKTKTKKTSHTGSRFEVLTSLHQTESLLQI